MNILKYIFILLIASPYSTAQGNNIAYADDAVVEKRLPATRGMVLLLQLESIKAWLNRHPNLLAFLKKIEGEFEFRFKLSLRKEKVMRVKLFTQGIYERLSWRDRRLLRKGLRQLQFSIKGNTEKQSLPKFYKTSWILKIQDGIIAPL